MTNFNFNFSDKCNICNKKFKYKIYDGFEKKDFNQQNAFEILHQSSKIIVTIDFFNNLITSNDSITNTINHFNNQYFYIERHCFHKTHQTAEYSTQITLSNNNNSLSINNLTIAVKILYKDKYTITIDQSNPQAKVFNFDGDFLGHINKNIDYNKIHKYISIL